MKSAVVILNSDGSIVKTYSPDIGNITPTTGQTDLEILLQAGYIVKRETALDGGKVLIVLEKP